MKIICNQQKITDAVSNVQRIVSTKTTIPALEGIIIKTLENSISIGAYNLEIAITTTINAQVIEKGEIVLNAKLFSDIIRRLPEENIKISTDKKYITSIESGNANYNIVGVDANKFPEVPNFQTLEKIEIQNSILKDMIKQTLFAISDDITKPVITGSLFKIENKEFRIISVDGFRMALRKEKIDYDIDSEFIVPKKALEEILRINAKDDSITEIMVGERHAIFKIEDYVIHTRLLEGNFLDYKTTFPNEFETEFPIGSQEITNSVERMSLLTTERIKSPIRLKIETDHIYLSCATTIGKAHDILKTIVSGKTFEIGFNNRYILDALKNVESDLIKIKLNSPLKPMIIEPIEGDSFKYLVVPMRLNNENKKEAKEE